MKGQGLVEYALILVLIAIVVIVIVALIGEGFDEESQFECDTANHIGWEREYVYSHTTYIWVNKVMVPVSHYKWVRGEQLSEKDYAIYCLGA